MKVLYFTHYADLYGANKSLIEMITTLRDLYNIYPIVIAPKKGKLSYELDKLGIENYSFNFYPWVYNENDNFISIYAKILRKHLINYLAIKNIYKLIKQKNIDLVHTNSSVIDIGAEIANMLNKPHIWHIREFGEEDYNLKFFIPVNKAINYIENNSSKVIFISHSLYGKYIKMFIHKNKSVLVYNGVKKDKYFTSKKFQELKNNKLRVIFSGLLSKEKNQLELIKAVNHLINTTNKIRKSDIELIFLGNGNESYKNELMDFCKKNNLNDLVKFLGYIDNVKELISKCHIGVVCSYKEAFGRVTVEYMMAGLPVIASNTGANAEIITDGVEGYIYEYGNFKSLADKIYKLYCNRLNINILGKNAQEKACKLFASERNAHEIYNVYKELTRN